MKLLLVEDRIDIKENRTNDAEKILSSHMSPGPTHVQAVLLSTS